MTKYRTPLLVALGVAALAAYAILTDAPPRSADPFVPPDPEPLRDPPVVFSGVSRPPTVPAAAADLEPTEEVVGVVTGGKARAYRLRVLSGRPEDHVINDLVGSTPVTVTYSNLGSRVRVFTAEQAEPLDVRFRGTAEGMVLVIGERSFSQVSGQSVDPGDTGTIPLAALPFDRTTWQKWRDAHPGTDVFQGGPATAAPRGSSRPTK